ncbi:IclR family transcriptional regulator [Ornithinicoccus halotolerans]|uniref:IclR family transcriptional regulator n=1 Tax=Ornithinicoccus halotolerans TaxID=1748220 RepID=UPI001885E5AC|nr:helix-turn-helix domain-containing protein [Ornithinicoccus halotolerans]
MSDTTRPSGADPQRDHGRAAVETAQTLDRGLQVLQLLGAPGGHGGLTMSELADDLGVGRAVVYRLVATLVGREFAVRGPDGRVRLGPAMARLVASVRPVVVEAARPVLRRLAEEHGATAHFTVVDGPDGTDALAVLVVEPTWTDFHVGYRVGSRHPLTQGAAGRALLAGREDNYGVIATHGELQQGAHGLAAAVPGLSGVEASVGLVGMSPFDEDLVGAAVVAAAEEISAMLRGQPDSR